jgi:hypothetical protein
MATKNKADHCTKEMMQHSMVCALYPKSKMTKCLKDASNIHTACSLGVSSGDIHSNSKNYPSSNDHNVAKHHSGDYVASNGDKYNNGKLVAFVSPSNGLSYTVRRPGPRG